MASLHKLSPTNRRRFIKTAGAATVAGLAGCTSTDDSGGDGDGGSNGSDYPDDLINFIVPYGEGGGTDIYARHFIPLVSEILDTPMQVENIEGAGATRGMTAISQADSDGYEIGMGVPPGTGIINYLAAPDQFEIDYADFTPIGIVGQSTHVIAVNPDLDVDYQGLIDLYQSGDISTFGGQEVGSMVHIGAIQARDNHGMEFDEYVAYDGTAPTFQAVASGEVPAGISSETGAEPFAEDGDIEVVADLSHHGGLVMDIPSVEDFGYDNIDQFSLVSRAIMGPLGLNESVVDKLEGAFEEAANSEESEQWEEETGNVVLWGDREDCREAWHGSLERIPEEVDMEMVREAIGYE